MKAYLLLVFLLYFTPRTSGETSYTTKYDNLNLDEILTSERLLNGYINCLLDNGPCTPDGKELKNNLPDAIQNDCKKCTERQQEGADKVMHYIIDHRPDDWIKLEKKYESDGSYKEKYLVNMKKRHENESSNKVGEKKSNSSEDKQRK